MQTPGLLTSRFWFRASLLLSLTFPFGCPDTGPDEQPSPTPTFTPVPPTPTATLQPTPSATPTPTLPPPYDLDEDGYGLDEDDCDDLDPNAYPGAPEVPYDGVDQDCDGQDEVDVDDDGVTATQAGGDDCDDLDANTYPGAAELGDQKDNDCDGEVDDGVDSVDNDGDGYSELEGDCRDDDPQIHPAAEEVPYDGIDQDCSGRDLTDQDGDGFAGGSSGTDCDDSQPSVHPGAEEVPYDGIDQNCDGTDLIDVDEDGFPGGPDGSDCNDAVAGQNPGAEELAYDGVDQDCDGEDLTDVDQDGQDAQPVGGQDCDDANPDIYFGATEIPYDTLDQDCSGSDLTDVDGDTFDGIPASGTDCDDEDLNTYPGAAEFADGKDNDCDGAIDDGLSTTDDDLDGFAESTGDCNDGDASIYPNAAEVPYDGIDQDCDGLDLTDVDQDGYDGGPSGQDCDDNNISIYPTASEVAYDGIDQDCSGSDLTDVDEDGYASSEVGGPDCDDTTASINPEGTEIAYDGIDQDCANGDLVDVDEDGYASSTVGGPDCADTDDAIHPAALEVCDGIDNNCDTVIDEDAVDRPTFYLDGDHDGYGDPSQPQLACTGSSSLVSDNTDCDDSTAISYPGAQEVCDLQDNDCDGNVDEGVQTVFYTDQDSDGFGDANAIVLACSLPIGAVSDATDCDDQAATVFPGATEVCNEIDENCNGLVDEDVQLPFYADADGDLYGNANDVFLACSAPAGYVEDATDCNDQSVDENPGATEVCDEGGIDEDCNGLANDQDPGTDPGSMESWYPDADMDGYGSASASPTLACEDPSVSSLAYVANAEDCLDSNATVSPVGTESANGLDDDCDGTVDDGVLFTSCKTMLTATPGLPSGVYTIDADGPSGAEAAFQVYCDMTSDGGGWTLVMKVDGSKTTFNYPSAYWTNTSTYQPTQLGIDNNETKLASYHTVPFTQMRVGLSDGTIRWATLPASGSSLYAVIKTEAYTFVDAPRETWLSLVSGAAMQPNCNTRGFNPPGNLNHSRVRIGITGNNEGDCSSCDSFIGIGGHGMGCGTTDAGNAAGNWMTCEASVNKRMMGYVLVR